MKTIFILLEIRVDHLFDVASALVLDLGAELFSVLTVQRLTGADGADEDPTAAEVAEGAVTSILVVGLFL